MIKKLIKIVDSIKYRLKLIIDFNFLTIFKLFQTNKY